MVRLKVIQAVFMLACFLYFNSTMVRLKDHYSDLISYTTRDFNSTMVRLKEKH